MYTTYKGRCKCKIMFYPIYHQRKQNKIRNKETKFILQNLEYNYKNNNNKINSYGSSMLELTDKIFTDSVLDISVNSALKQ